MLKFFKQFYFMQLCLWFSYEVWWKYTAENCYIVMQPTKKH